MNKTLPNILGKEFDCINKIIKNLPTKNIGDDCAVLDFGGDKLLISMDTFCEKTHFDNSYFTLQEIGQRCAEATISDIAAMGGIPLYITLSISTDHYKKIPMLCDGVKKSLLRHKVFLIGGDIIHSDIFSVSITVIGKTKKAVYRSGAKAGDSIYITGHTGLASAGLYALKNKIKKYRKLKNKHKSPVAKINSGIKMSKYTNSMIDISDGLATELYHLAHQSGVNIQLNKLPIDKELTIFCRKMKLDENDFALFGGEDYELLMSIPEKFSDKTKGLIKIGQVMEKSSKPKILFKNEILKIKKGFKHF